MHEICLLISSLFAMILLSVNPSNGRCNNETRIVKIETDFGNIQNDVDARTRYFANESCTWQLISRDGTTLRFIFEVLDLEWVEANEPKECHFDWVEIRNKLEDTRPIVKACNYDVVKGKWYSSRSSVAYVVFRTDENTQYHGFKLKWETLDASESSKKDTVSSNGDGDNEQVAETAMLMSSKTTLTRADIELSMALGIAGVAVGSLAIVLLVIIFLVQTCQRSGEASSRRQSWPTSSLFNNNRGRARATDDDPYSELPELKNLPTNAAK